MCKCHVCLLRRFKLARYSFTQLSYSLLYTFNFCAVKFKKGVLNCIKFWQFDDQSYVAIAALAHEICSKTSYILLHE